MEFQNIEWTVEDMLVMHRHWITKLYIEDGKTEIEIVQELHERQVTVTVSQIKKCIREWNLIQPTTSKLEGFATSSSYITSRYLESYLPTLNSTPRTLASINYEELYLNPPLPELPSKDRTPHKSPPKLSKTPSVSKDYTSTGYLSHHTTPQTTPPKPSPNNKHTLSPKDRIKLTCHHGNESSASHELECTLEELPSGRGPSQLEMYAETEDDQERFATGMGGRPTSPLIVLHARAGDRSRRLRGKPLRPKVRLDGKGEGKDEERRKRRRRKEKEEGGE